MKAILVIDIDDDMIGEVDYTVLSKAEMVNGRAELRPLPEKKTEEEEMAKDPFNEDLFYDEYIWGWNACLDEIVGETE